MKFDWYLFFQIFGTLAVIEAILIIIYFLL